MTLASMVVLSLSLTVAQEEAPTSQAGAAAAPIEAQARPFRMVDLSATVLDPGRYEVGVVWGRVTRGIFPRFQLTSHLGVFLGSLVNLSARYLLLDLPQLRVSLEVGAWWLAAGPLFRTTVVDVPAEARASAALAYGFEASFALRFNYRVLYFPEVVTNFANLGGEATLSRYDSRGAWFLQARVPFVGSFGVAASLLGVPLEGSTVFDNLSAWSVLFGRDLQVGERTHLRLGLGYRNRPGIVGLDSIGPVVFNLDLYWRL